MTVIDIMRKPDSVTVVAAGHAKAPRNEDGRDLVCCAISTMLTALAVSCANLRGPATIFHTSDGFAELTIQNIRTEPDAVHHRVQMLIDGLTTLSQQYPQNIRLTITD